MKVIKLRVIGQIADGGKIDSSLDGYMWMPIDKIDSIYFDESGCGVFVNGFNVWEDVKDILKAMGAEIVPLDNDYDKEEARNAAELTAESWGQ